MTDLAYIKKTFMEVATRLSKATEESLLNEEQPHLYESFRQMDQLAAMDVDDREATLLRNDSELQAAITTTSRLKRANGLRLEIETAGRIIRSKAPWEELKQFTYYKNYIQLAQMESSGGDLSAGDRVVFLGSGPLPLTLICLCRQYDIRGLGIEQYTAYADLSRELIKVLGMDQQIQILHGNHFLLPLPEPVQLLMIGADARPKDEIFAHLKDALPDGTTLSYRIYEKGLRRLLDAQSEITLPIGFTEVKRIRPEPPVNNTSVFVVKQNGKQ